MLTESKLKFFLDLTESFSKEELIWVNGYLSALVANGETKPNINGNGHAMTGVNKISIVYGTETGNSKKLATDFAVLAKKKGVAVKLTSLDQYRFSNLEKEEYLFVIISTHGEGEPPAAAKSFYDYVQRNELKLPNLKYSVLALGDTAYPFFCTAGEAIDARLEKAGGKRIIPLQKCDVDYEHDAQNWFEQVLEKLENKLPTAKAITLSPVKKSTGRKYYDGRVITNINLNDRGSKKETYHIEISTNETIDYEPGDSLAIIPLNKKNLVEELIRMTGIDGSLEIKTSKVTAPARELLTKHLNICYLLSSTLKKYAHITEREVPDVRVDLIDLLRLYPVKTPLEFEEIIKILPPIAPRLYSISSSPAVHDQEIHITVSKDSFYLENEQRYGLCSEFIGGLPVDTEIKFYIHRNRAFKLPSSEKDIIMIGPGTGIASARSFIAERDATAARGNNWLFFGEEHFTKDFLYQLEIQNYLLTGVLNKISLAFSGDEKKLFIQNKMLEEKEELVKWINGGAHIYISGTKEMCVDVEDAFLDIIGEGQIKELKAGGRYQKDIY